MASDPDDPAVLRGRLVDQLISAELIRTAAVEEAFRAVPRHVFLPGSAVAAAYADEAVVTKWAADGRPISSSSQPAIMALMLEQLDVRPGQRVLEIGAGTGYNAALLAHLVGPAGQVVTVDVDADLADLARARLAELGVTGVRVACADGAGGDPAGGQFDRIIVTAGAWDLAPAWRAQLADGGRLVLPLSLRGMQRAVAFEPDGDGWESRSIIDCGFMPLRGAMAEPGGPRQLGGQAGLFVNVDDDRELDTDALYAALAEPGEPVSITARLTLRDIWGGLALWLALHEPDAAGFGASGTAVELDLIPPLLSFSGQAMTLGVIGPGSLAMLAHSAPAAAGTPAGATGAEAGGADAGAADAGGGAGGAGAPTGVAGGELVARGHGPGGAELAGRLAAQVDAWDLAGRPGSGRLRLRARPIGSAPDPSAMAIEKRYVRVELHWSAGRDGAAG